MQFLSILKMLLSLFPLIIQVVQAAEAFLPQSGSGATKLALVRSTIEAAYKHATSVEYSFEQVWPPIQSAVEAVVGAANAVGLFRKQT